MLPNFQTVKTFCTCFNYRFLIFKFLFLLIHNVVSQKCYAWCPNPPAGREDLHDNATRKGREIYCWLESGPLLQPTKWCKVREPRAPVSTHIYRVLDFKHKQWVVITSGLVICLRSNFIGQTHFKIFARQGTFPEVYWAPADWLVSGGLLRVDNYPTLGRNWNLGLLIVQDACHGASYAHFTILKFFPNIPFFFLF